MARILVIDDEHNIRLMVRLALQHVGHMDLQVSRMRASGKEGRWSCARPSPRKGSWTRKRQSRVSNRVWADVN